MPERLSVMGFGDFEIGRVCVPSLSTIRVDAQAIGSATGQLVLAMLKNGADAPSTLDLGFEVLARRSTGRPAGVA